VTLDAVIIHISVWIHGWLRYRAVGALNARFSYQNFGAEHLLCPISYRVSVIIAVGRIFGKVICTTPHTTSAIGHIEALITFIDTCWICISSTMIHLSLSGMFFPTILNANGLRLIVILSPKVLVLDPFDSLDLCLWHGQLEIIFQSVPLVACLGNVFNHDLVIFSCQQFYLVLPIIR
jgi:hypothetical protein